MNRILLIQLKRIGDVLLTTPVLAALRDAHPEAKLVLAIDSNAAGLAYGLDADEVLVRPRGWGALNFVRKVRKLGPYDLALDFTGNDRSALLSALSTAKMRVTYSRFADKPMRRQIFTTFVDSSVRNQHTVDHHLDLLQSIGLSVQNVQPTLRIPEAATRREQEILAREGIYGPFAVIHAGSARSEKFWTESGWQDVCHFLAKKKYSIVFTGSSADAEQAHIKRIRAGLSIPSVDFSGILSLLETAAVLKRADLVCAVDSAPVHLCDAFGTPVIVLFGPTNPHHWRPRGTQARIVRPAGAGPEGPRSAGGKMTAIPNSAVIDAIEALSLR